MEILTSSSQLFGEQNTITQERTKQVREGHLLAQIKYRALNKTKKTYNQLFNL